MSFIANILSQIKQPSKKKEVHPALEQMIKQKDKKKSGRKKYFVLLVTALVYFVSTLGVSFFFKQETQDVKRALGLIKDRSSELSVANLPNNGKKNDTPSPKDMAEIDKNMSNTISSTQNQQSNLPSQSQVDSNNPQKKPDAIEDNLKNVISIVTDTAKNIVDTKDIKNKVSKALTKKYDELTNTSKSMPANRFDGNPNNNEKQNTQNDFDQTEKDNDSEMKVRVTKDGDTNFDYTGTIPTVSGRHLYLGINLEKKGEYHNAYNEYKLASITDGVSYRLLNRMAFVLIKTHRYSEAIEYAQMAIKIKEDYTPAIINLAIAYAKSNHNDLALDTFEYGLKMSPYNSELLYNLAVFHERNNQRDSAHNIYSRLVEIGDKRGKLGLERMENISGEQK